jgi:Ca2+/Na+ antiporter
MSASFHKKLGKSKLDRIQSISDTRHKVKQVFVERKLWQYIIGIIVLGLSTFAAVYCIQYVTDYKSTYNRLQIMYERILNEPTLSQVQKQKLTENHPFRTYMSDNVINGYSAKCIGLIIVAIIAFIADLIVLYFFGKKVKFVVQQKLLNYYHS